jgi:putative SOS response-associated peptidase YedK
MMCNDFGNHVAYAEYADALKQLGMPLVAPAAPPNLEPRSDIWPTETAPMFLAAEGGVELAQMRWGFPVSRPGGRPVINFRSEGRDFSSSRRCLVPASHFYEFKGHRAPKEKYKFTLADKQWFCFAGLWRPAEGAEGPSFTLLTTAPGPDVAPIHDRQMVIVERSRWNDWLALPEKDEGIAAPLPEGSLIAERVR